MTRRKFTPTFKTKVVLEALKERQTTNELAQKYDVSPQQISTWKILRIRLLKWYILKQHSYQQKNVNFKKKQNIMIMVNMLY